MPTEHDAVNASADVPDERRAVVSIIMDVWQRILGVDRISLGDEFFDFEGADSVIATRMLLEIQQELGVEVPLIVVFEFPRFREFCEQVHRIHSNAVPG